MCSTSISNAFSFYIFPNSFSEDGRVFIHSIQDLCVLSTYIYYPCVISSCFPLIYWGIVTNIILSYPRSFFPTLAFMLNMVKNKPYHHGNRNSRLVKTIWTLTSARKHLHAQLVESMDKNNQNWVYLTLLFTIVPTSVGWLRIRYRAHILVILGRFLRNCLCILPRSAQGSRVLVGRRRFQKLFGIISKGVLWTVIILVYLPLRRPMD